MVFHATFNNISIISWQSVLLVEKTGVPGENLSQVTDKKKVAEHKKIQKISIYVRIHVIVFFFFFLGQIPPSYKSIDTIKCYNTSSISGTVYMYMLIIIVTSYKRYKSMNQPGLFNPRFLSQNGVQ